MEENAPELGKKLEMFPKSSNVCWKCHKFRLCPHLNLTTPNFRSMEWSLDCSWLSQNCLCGCVKSLTAKRHTDLCMYLYMYLLTTDLTFVFFLVQKHSQYFSKDSVSASLPLSLKIYSTYWKTNKAKGPRYSGVRSVMPMFAAYTMCSSS